MSDKDDALKFAANNFSAQLRALIQGAQLLFAGLGVSTEEQGPVFVTLLATVTAEAARHFGLNRETFDAAVKQMADRIYQPPREAGVTTRDRGSA